MTTFDDPEPPSLDAELRERVTFYPAPDDSFQPLKVDDPRALLKFGLLPVPEYERFPEAYALWVKLYDNIEHWVQAGLSLGASPQALRPSLERWSMGSTLYESSANWSGLYITPRDGQMFTQVYGTWNVPSIAESNDGGPPDNYHSSTWIGLDGQRAYYNSSLPQIGTEQYLETAGTVTTVQTGSFWQWWSRERPGRSRRLELSVSPGDEVICVLVVLSAHRVKFQMKNQTTGHILSPFDVRPPHAKIPLRVSAATAEWVMERSTHPDSDGVLEQLPEYSSITFSGCGALTGVWPGMPEQKRTLIDGQRITMRKAMDRATRTAPISRPTTVVAPFGEEDPHGFTTSYVGS
jgi:hypothetical protein